MAEQLPDRPDERHPIVAGLLALVGVGLAVGLVLGAVVLIGTKVTGLGGNGDSQAADGAASLYLPTPVSTTAADGPQVTLEPQPSDLSPPTTPSIAPSQTKKPEKAITLSASTTQAGTMEQFQLTGVYPLGEGAILTVQRFDGGGWRDFPATGSVSGETFQIPVQASKPGVNRFRVVDSDSGVKSNEVRVKIGG